MSTIHVLQEDINSGIAKDSNHCPVAESIYAEIEGAKYVSVDMATIRYSVGDTRYIFSTPASVAAFLVNFDIGVKLKPFKFRLQKPLKEINRIARQENRARHTAREKAKKGNAKPKTTKKQRSDGGGAVGTTVQTGGKAGIPVASLSNLAVAKRVGRARSYGMRNLTIYGVKDD